ncbi:hypothetical protein C8R43DRAFT_1171600 [Mycena crocata]|nr:hypothetical protein C8R43DRAFT_1171600 [Mycena crocata]
MSSRAASGRKRLRPAPTAPSPLSTVPPSPQPNASAFNRPEIDSSVSYASPQDLRIPEAPMHVRSVPPPSPSSPSSSGFPRHFPYSSQLSRDLLHRAQRSSQTTDGLTPYPLPSQFQPYQPPPLRKEKPMALRARNPSPESQSPNSAPSYTSFSVHFSDSEGGDSRRSSTSRALPPYPSTPPVATGWAALSDMKVASAIAVPPSYPEDLRAQTNPYPSPPLRSSFDLQNSTARPASVASSSRLPPTSERSETSRSNYHPPYYSPPSSPRRLPSRLKVSSTLGACSPQQHNSSLDGSSPAASYPTPHSSSFSSPSTSLASLPVINSRLDTHHESSLSGSSDSISGGSLASSTRPGQYHGNPAMQSSQSVSSSSSAKLDPSPTAETRPADPTFVFPSSRSRARPSGSAPGVSGFRFRGRRKLKAPFATVQVLAPGTPIPSEGVFTAQPQSRSQIRAPTASSNGDQGRRAPLPPNLRLAPTISAGSGSSGSGSAVVAPTFYFPSARTRAHPKSPTQFSFNKGKKREHDGVKQSRFLKMGLNRKKVASTPVVVQDGSPSPMEQTFLTSLPQDERRPSLGGQDASGRENVTRIATKVGTYPLDAYDAALMESDRQTWELLRKLNSTNSPSFHNYEGRPPRYVLDLGCGAGHWMLDAAVAWRNSGTQIIGFDMVDTTKGLWSTAQRQGVANNIRFVRGNFLKQSLPFPDASFQLVRMASLALSIPHDMWEFVLHEAHRVLAVGGRLEFIDDHVFFPYGKPPLMSPSAPPQSAPVPHLDMMIPSTVFSRMSLADVVNPSLKEDTDSEIYNLYGVEEEEHSDADTVASGPQRETPTPHGRSSSTSSLSGPPADPEAWHEQAAAARELESLFEHMVNVKYGIHLRPSEFIFEMMMRVFGAAKEITAMHLTLAPPDQSTVGLQRVPSPLPHQRPTSSNVRPHASSEAPDSDTLGHCPGLILWPTTFIPMTLTELETHASKHLRVLLSCKSALVNYASEIADQGEAETQGEAAMEALWEYQNFLRERYNPPPEDPTRGMSDTSSTDDANSIRNSIFSVSSVGSEALDAMRDYQSELHSRFEWTSEPARSLRETPTPTATPRASVIESLAPPPASTSALPRVRKSRSRGSRGRDRASSVASTVAPPYSRIELTHVRTFYIYEAVKVVDARFGGPI